MLIYGDTTYNTVKKENYKYKNKQLEAEQNQGFR